MQGIEQRMSKIIQKACSCCIKPSLLVKNEFCKGWPKAGVTILLFGKGLR